MTISTENEKSNDSILTLAKKCMLINAEKENVIIALLKERQEKEPECSVIDVIKENNILSQEKLDFLLAFKKFMETQALDIEYGELAVANKFATKESIDEALNFQNEFYSKTEQTKEISEVLLKKRAISLKHSTAILLSQNRIDDSLLADALYNLGSTENEKKAIYKRFGVIALKKELITLEQLNRAFLIQNRESDRGFEKRHLHKILEESAELKEEDSIIVLKEQKQFEKRRLNIEKALSNYNTDIKLNTKLNKLFQYRISKDGIEAYVQKSVEVNEKIKLYEFLLWLKQAGIKYGVVDDNTIEDFIKNKPVEEEIVIAKGYPPIDGEDETVEFLFDTEYSLPKENIKEDQIPLVKQGDVLAIITPGKLGKHGKDVLGNLIEAPAIKKCSFNCGDGVAKKDLKFVAKIDGIPSFFKEKTILVSKYPADSKIKVVSKNIEGATGEEYKSFDLEIDGIIEKDGAIMCHHIMLKGNTLGVIAATGDVQIQGSVGQSQTDKGNEETDSDVRPKIFADGDIVIKQNIFNAKLETGKELIAPAAEVISSNIIAIDGITLKSIMFSEDNPSVLQIGKKSDPKIRRIDDMIDSKISLLKELKHQDELKEIKEKYNKQLSVKNGYLEKTNVIEDILKRLEESPSGGVKSLKQNQYPDIPENEIKNEYALEIIKELINLEEQDQKKHLKEMMTIESGMYKAAKEVTEKLHAEQKIRIDEIEEKIKEKYNEIEQIELEIETLLLGRDTFALQQKHNIVSKNVAIKIKDQIAKGTIIKGQASEMVIPETMYGVKLMENNDPKTGESNITIEGYFS